MGPEKINAEKVITLTALAAVIAGTGWWLFSSNGGDRYSKAQPDAEAIAQGSPMVEVRLPDTLSAQAQIGQRGFQAMCAECHGENAAGRNGMAPPLVHRIYEPSHHADAAFLRAAQNGVRAHHWNFGNMPPVEGITRAEITAITAYVRELQRTNGIN